MGLAQNHTKGQNFDLVINNLPYNTFMKFSKDGKYFISYTDNHQLCDSKTGRVIRNFYGKKGRSTACCLSNDNNYLFAISGYEIIKWDTRTGEIIKTGSIDSTEIKYNFFSALDITPDEKHIVALTRYGIALVDPETLSIIDKMYKDKICHSLEDGGCFLLFAVKRW
jgi:WD40 repeat protein